MSEADGSSRGSAVSRPGASVSITSTDGVDQVGDQRGEAVVVAEADLVVGDGVVLVDHGNDAEVEQAQDRPACMQVLLAHTEVERREQHLARRRPRDPRTRCRSTCMSRLWPTADTACRVCASRGRRVAVQLQGGQTGGDRARGDRDDTACPSSRRAATSLQNEATASSRISPSRVGDRRGADLAHDLHDVSTWSSGSYSNVNDPMRTRSPSAAPARAKARSTPRDLSRPCAYASASGLVRSDSATARSA